MVPVQPGIAISVAEAAATPDAMVACGDGPAFPLAALDGPQGAEMAADPAAQRLARATTTGEVGYLPRGGWMRVLDAPDLVVMATWLHLPRSLGGPLLQATLTPDASGATDPDAWHIRSAGFCWPHAVLGEDIDPIAWMPAAPVPSDARTFTAIPATPLCPGTAQEPIVVLTPERVSVTLSASAELVACAPEAAVPVEVTLPEPLGGRELLDGATDPPASVQAATATEAAPPDLGEIDIDGSVQVRTIAASAAIADALGSLPGLVPVTVVDELFLEVRLTAARDLILAGPPRLCLVGPNAAPDDAGLIDRCWGDPDPGAALAPSLPRDADGYPILRAGAPVAFEATIGRGDVRCDYPPGDWHLEIVLTPRVDGHGWTDVALGDMPLHVDATGLVPGRELGRLESRYCGMASRPVPDDGSPAPGS